jgi:drug/metabolite transporter (DMT)-like permease
MKQKLAPIKEVIGPVSLLSIGVLYGLSAVITKYLSDYINAYQVIEYRFGVAFVVALLILVFLKRRPSLKGLNKKVLLAFAISFPASAILFTLSVFHASVALAVFTFYAANLIAQFGLGRLVFNEKIGWAKGLAFVVSVASLVSFTNPFGDFVVSAGLVYGVISGVVQGLASVFQKQLSNTTDKTNLLVIQTLAGVLLAAVILLATGDSLLPGLPAMGWLATGIFGLSMLAIMYLFLVGYKYTNLNVGGILVSSELFFAPLLAFILLSEHIATNVFVGGVLTAVAAVLVSVPVKRRVAT